MSDEDVPLEDPVDPSDPFECPFVAFDSDVLRGVTQGKPCSTRRRPQSLGKPCSTQRRTALHMPVASYKGPFHAMSFDPPGAFLSAPRHSPPAPLRKLVTVSAQTKLQHDFAEGGESQLDFSAAAWDDVTGQALDADEVAKARAKEMTYLSLIHI